MWPIAAASAIWDRWEELWWGFGEAIWHFYVWNCWVLCNASYDKEWGLRDEIMWLLGCINVGCQISNVLTATVVYSNSNMTDLSLNLRSAYIFLMVLGLTDFAQIIRRTCNSFWQVSMNSLYCVGLSDVFSTMIAG